jgi:NitT/TauT family transport system substrate-binding protein
MTARPDRRKFATLAGASLLTAPLASRAWGQALTPIKVGYDGFSMTTAPMNYAMQKGFFRKHGLDLTMVYIDSGVTLTQAVVGGSVDIGQNGYTPAAAAAVQGGDIVFIGGISNKLPFQLIVKSEIKTAADLKGKKIAISRLGSSSDTAAGFALAHLGLKRSDVTLLQLGGEGTRTAAMMSGQIDGSMEQLPRSAELEETGKYHMLVDCTVVAGDYPNTAYVARRATLKAKPDLVKRFMMAISESIHAYKTNKAEALELSAAFLKTPNNHALEATYDSFTRIVFPDIPRPSLKGIDLVLEEMKEKLPAAGNVKAAQLVDTTALDELEKEGFFAKLMK